MFDEIYWDLIDERYFGPSTTIEEGLGFLNAEEGEEIDTFVDSKLQQQREGTLVSHYSINELVGL